MAGSDRGAEDTAEFIMSEFENTVNSVKYFGNKYIPREFITNLIIDVGIYFKYTNPLSKEITYDSNVHIFDEDTTDLDIQFDKRNLKSHRKKPLEVKISAEEQKVWTATYKTLNQKWLKRLYMKQLSKFALLMVI